MLYNHPRKGTSEPRVAKSGYIMIMVDNKECYQHRVVMEDFIGRKLYDDEVVHHCDENKQNNLLINLELMLKFVHYKHHMTKKKAKLMSVKGHKRRWNYVSDV